MLLDSEHSVDVIYLEFGTAFGRIPQRRPVYKLQHFRIRGDLLWLEAFLSDITSSVRVGSYHSSLHPVIGRVPQGFILGPMLFLMFVSDLVYHVNLRVSFHADNTKLYANPHTDYVKLQQNLDKIAR